MPEAATPATARPAVAAPEEAWLAPVRRCALAVFVAMPVLGWLAPQWLGRVFWTVTVASLPLLIVLAGYHRWRQICPLAWFAQLPARIGHPGGRRASLWLQSNYYYVVFGFLGACLWLRLVATNGHGGALALFIILLSFAAFAFGATYTGKTWCNYVCPVSFVEKIYTEPHGLRPTPNSQCSRCTACKPACPDINEENGYWKEILSGPKRFVYFAFPGLVFAFYFYFYLQSGTWDYYFGGAWTNEPEVPGSAFLPGTGPRSAGFYFLPSWPRAAAALLTLALGALLSLGLFSLVERFAGQRLRQRDEEASGVRHLMFTAAAFVAFVTFYTFAGAPTIRLLPGASHLVQVLVVVTATLFLVRRFKRRQQAYAEETLARQIIRRWEWADMKPPEDLHEAFLIHTIRSQTHASGYAQLLEIYKEGVREALASGFVTRGQVQRLESLRNQLQISQADHERIMADLDEEERSRISSPALQVSAEKRLQLEAYSRALENYLGRVAQAAASPDERVILHLRRDFSVTAEEHAAVLDELLSRGQGTAPHVASALQVIEEALRTIGLLHAAPSASGDFLVDALARRCAHATGGLMLAFGADPEQKKNAALREQLRSEEEAEREAAVEALGARVGQAAGVAARMAEARREAAREAATRATLAQSVRPHLESADPYVRVAALYLLHERAGVDEDTLKAMVLDEYEVVCETAVCLLMRTHQLESREQTGLVTVERMIALRSVPLFSSLKPGDLAGLAQASIEREFAGGKTLCVEGEPGDEAFILLSGEVKVLQSGGAEERVMGREGAGGFIEELAVLDSAPRTATVVAGADGARVLCLKGKAFREVLRTNPSVVGEVIRALAARLRGTRAQPQGGRTAGEPSQAAVSQAAGAKPGSTISTH